MKMPSRPVAVLSAVALLAALGGGALLLAGGDGGETCFDRMGGPGPNSNTPRLHTMLDVPVDQWPALAQLLKAFAAERGWAVQDGPGTSDPSYAWLDMCDAAVTIVRANNRYDGEERPGFGVIHMTYPGPGNDAWQPVYRDLHRRIEARGPGRIRYREGEFGRMIERPEWLGPGGAAAGN